MLIEKITENEIQFMEMWHTPQAISECMFSNLDNLAEFDPEIFSELRMYQLTMLSHESLIDENMPGLKEKEKFNLRKGAGDIFCNGSRKHGKSLISMKLDIMLSLVRDSNWPCAIASADAFHLNGVLDDVKKGLDYHPILKHWVLSLEATKRWCVTAKNGWKLDGINMNIKSKSPGDQFYGKHVKRLYIEENTLETNLVADKRKDSLSELGAVLRFSGMCNFTKQTPAGKIFYDKSNVSKIVNYPQYVSPLWDSKEKEDKIKEYGSEDDTNYKVFVKGEPVADGVAFFDMDRVEKNYVKSDKIKRFEINKENFKFFKNLLIVEKPKNAERIFISADEGDNISDIVIHSEIGDKYSYLYNIVLYGTILDEEEEIWDFLIKNLEANVLSVDNGDARGRILCDHLEAKYSKDNVVRYQGQGKVDVEILKDAQGEPIYDSNRKLKFRQEYMAEWSVSRLSGLFYGERVRIPTDDKLDQQINSVTSVMCGNRATYPCICSSGDHLWSAWKVFSIGQWLKQDFNKTLPIKVNDDWGIGNNSGIIK